MTGGNSLTDLLTIYLYKNKYLSLPKLGRFDVSEEVDLDEAENVGFSRIPQGAITFTHNPGEETDTELIKYITGHTRKMQSLAIADLFTLTDQALQMLNILQPVSFPGIGTLRKDIKGVVSFTPGDYRPELLRNYRAADYPSTAVGKTSTAGSSVPSTSSRSSRSIGGIFIIVICILIAGVLVYFMFSHIEMDKGSKGEEMAVSDKLPAADSTPINDSVEAMPGSSRAGERTPKTGVIHYEVVFEHADSSRAFFRYDQLTEWGHHVIVRTTDSIHYTLAIPFTTAASDTTRVKDSISIFFARPTTIRYNPGQ